MHFEAEKSNLANCFSRRIFFQHSPLSNIDFQYVQDIPKFLILQIFRCLAQPKASLEVAIFFFFFFCESLSQKGKLSGFSKANSGSLAIPEHFSCIAGALQVHCMCTTGALQVHCRCIACALKVHWRCIAGALLVHSSCTACALLVHCLCIACALLVHCLCIEGALKLHYGRIAGVLKVHCRCIGCAEFLKIILS